MTDWLFDTLLWTAALIGLVLLIRRPVARWLGPQTAYALWAIPAIRLILPPLQLPSWLAPEPSAEAIQTTSTFLILDPTTPVATQEAVLGTLPLQLRHKRPCWDRRRRRPMLPCLLPRRPCSMPFHG